MKKIEMTPEQEQLYSELRLMVKKANQRLLRLERLTGKKGTFGAKQLYDYLGISQINAISETGRIKLSKKYSVNQLLMIRKATRQFLESGASTEKEVKRRIAKYEAQIEKETGKKKKISAEQADVLYRSGKNYTWIYEYIPKSEFWGIWVPTAKIQGWDVITWQEEISERIRQELDEELKADLEALYYYVMED